MTRFLLLTTLAVTAVLLNSCGLPAAAVRTVKNSPQMLNSLANAR